MLMDWGDKNTLVAFEELTFEFDELTRGLYLLTVFHKNQAFPCGYLVLWTPAKGVLSVVQSFVPEWARRHGVRAHMNHRLFQWFPNIKVIRTQKGTQDGTAWMERMGYKVDTRTTEWYVTSSAFSRAYRAYIKSKSST